MNRKIFPAHIRKPELGGEVQSVGEHCRAAAEYAAEALSCVGLNNSGYLAGLVHDAGKYTESFADYITRGANGETVRRGSVNHTFAGVRMMFDMFHELNNYNECWTCELTAYAAGAHHGLFDAVDENGESGFEHRTKEEYGEAIKNFKSECADEKELRELFSKANSELERALAKVVDLAKATKASSSKKSGGKDYGNEYFFFYISMLARLLLSAVIEGDRRDTAEFVNGAKRSVLKADAGVWRSCLERTEKKIRNFVADTPLNIVRSDISKQCRAFAEREGGIFKLNVPTGGGKTVSSLRYALAHCAKHDKKRIFFVMPLLAIIEQNADEIRKYVGDDRIVLEHHSNAAKENEKNLDKLDERELLAENWDAPIIITTLVQMLNTLFSGRTSCIRRFHALSDSVIIFDEVQTVPRKMITQFNLAMNFLSEVCGATVVLCSATQPAFEESTHPILCSGDIVTLNENSLAVFKRTEIKDAGEMKLSELVDFALEKSAENSSLLIVCNKRAQAKSLADELGARTDAKLRMLSASMCTQHRREVLEEIKAALRTGEKIICVATQVIEAGVDISFACAIRLLAGMDSVVQAAGRCNRNGEKAGAAEVYLVNIPDENLNKLEEIQKGKNASLSLLNSFGRNAEQYGGDLASGRAISSYYKRLDKNAKNNEKDYVFSLYDSNMTTSMFELLSTNAGFCGRSKNDQILQHMKQAKKKAGSEFKVFDDEGRDVIVPYGEGDSIITELSSERAGYDLKFVKEQMEKAKPYTISLYDYQLKKLRELGGIMDIDSAGALAIDGRFYGERGFEIEGDNMEAKIYWG